MNAATGNNPSVLVACRAKIRTDWARRWLSRYELAIQFFEDVSAEDLSHQLESANVLIIDCGLKRDNGDWLLEHWIEQAGNGCTIIALASSKKEIERARLHPNVDLFTKPFDWQFIARRVDRFSSLQRVEGELASKQQELDVASNSVEALQRELKSINEYEPVTGLPGRKRFQELVSRGMPAAAKGSLSLAVIVVSFARFKLIVEAMGQAEAEVILSGIARRLGRCLADVQAGSQDTAEMSAAIVGNLESNQFGVMLTWSGREDFLTEVGHSISQMLSAPIESSGHSVYLSACLGIASYPKDADTAESLLQRATNAMRQAARVGGGMHFFDRDSFGGAERTLLIEDQLAKSLGSEHLNLAYQPIFDSESGDLLTAEALLRWDQATELSTNTGEFVAIAEESDLILHIGDYVLDKAFGALQKWRREGLSLDYLCINIAKQQLLDRDFSDRITGKLAHYGLSPKDIELELSERGVLSSDAIILSQIHQLHDLGFRLSVDDFGTGQSSIGYLKDLPIDVLKIDQSYVQGMHRKKKDAALTSAMITLGQKLDLTVIAEGVETDTQLHLLRELGCDACQGFLLAKPMNGTAFEKLLSHQQLERDNRNAI